MKDILGWIAMTATCVQVLVGMTMQYRKLGQTGSTPGLSLGAVVSTGLGFLAWTSWALCPPGLNGYVAVPNGLGVLFTFAILCRMRQVGHR